MSWEFRPNMEVVCIDDTASEEYAPPPEKYVSTCDDMSGLCKGRIYTVRSVCDFYGVFAIRLHEIIRPCSNFGIEVPFAAARFRPLRKRETSIEIFKSMLTPSNQREDADA